MVGRRFLKLSLTEAEVLGEALLREPRIECVFVFSAQEEMWSDGGSFDP